MSRGIVVKVDPSDTDWSGMSDTTGALLTALTVKTARSDEFKRPGSVAVKVIVSLPFQVADGIVIVATREASILTVKDVVPE